MRRYLTLAAIVAISLAGCSGGDAESVSAADITAEPAEGLTIESQECELAQALDYFDPEGVEAGVVDACHVKTSGGPNYTLYGYDTEEGAIAAMLSWGTGIIGSAPFTQMEQVQLIPPDGLGDDAMILTSPSQGITRVVAQKGHYILQVTTGTDEAEARAVADEIMARIPDGAVPAAPAE